MRQTTRRYALSSSAALILLLAFDQVPSALLDAAGLHAAGSVRQLMNRIELNEEDTAAQTAGYYEGLLNEGSRVSSMGAFTSGRFGLGGGGRPPRSAIRALRLDDRYDRRPDFLLYEPKPNLNLPDYDDETLRLVTNSHGLSDREYAQAKPPGVRRIAVLGDSVTRGQGAPFGASYEALLERALNEPAGAGIEVINFAVSGYRVTQVVDMALERASAFSPDVYVIAISELTVFGRWSDHLKELVDQGIDLKYEFLRDVVRRSGVTPGDAAETAEARLAPFRVPTVRWAVETVARHAASRGAGVVVLLVPSAREQAAIDAMFAGIPEMLSELRVPVINLLDTFATVDDLSMVRVSSDNFHPNGPGHRRLFERIHDAVRTDPVIGTAVLGAGAGQDVK